MDLGAAPTLDLYGLLRASNDPIFIVNVHRRIVFLNPACEQLTGLKQDQVLGIECRWHGPLEPGDSSSLAASLCPPREAFAGSARTTPALILAGEGRRHWRLVDYFPIRATTGEIAAILGRISPESPEQGSSALESLPEQLRRLRVKLQDRFRIADVPALSAEMQRALAQVRLASLMPVSVLFTGESGSGREHLARVLHHLSERRDRPFLAIDCAALPHERLDAQLSPEGLLAPEVSLWGTLFLSDPVALDLELQRRLHKYLCHRPSHDDRRVVAASAHDLRVRARHGEFMPELLEQLGTLVIEVPPLRKRLADLPLLAQQALEDCNAEGGKQVALLQRAAIRALQGYSWPGNVGQLREVIRLAHARAKGVEVQPEDLPLIIQQATSPNRPTPRSPRPLPLDELLAEAERRIIQLALRDADGNVTQAAARLGISVARLSRRLTGLGLRATSPGNPESGQ